MSVIDGDGGLTGTHLDYPLDHNNIIYGMLTWNPIAQPASTFRRSAVLAAGNYDDSAPVEDYDLFLRLAARFKVANLPDRLLRYRIHRQSHTRRLEAEGRMMRRMTETFVRDAAAVYGLSPRAARRLTTARAFGTLGSALAISRSVARSRAESHWDHLRHPYLIATLRSMTHPWDGISRLGLALLDRKPRSFVHELRLILGQVIRRLPFGRTLLEARRRR